MAEQAVLETEVSIEVPGQGAVKTSVRQMEIINDILEYPLLPKAAQIVLADQKPTTSYLQRTLAIGYNKAARLQELLEKYGIISAADHVGKREILVTELPVEFANLEKTTEAAQKIASRRGPPMKETAQDRAVSDATYRVTADELKQFIERFERLEAEKKEIMDHQKEVMAEAKARGYDTKAMRKLIALRKRDADDVAEEEAVLDMYKEALGM